MKLKKLLLNGALFAGSSVLGLLLCEFASRLVLNPVDFLSPTLVRDDKLGVRLPPGSSGHDQWGFRNNQVPPSAEIVALGDSHTYGNCARLSESWPSQVARITGRSVYNLGMGGYGPNQYYHLFLTRALELKPKVVVCGLYMGDDFDNAFRITYGLEHWAPWRRASLGFVEADIWEESPPALSWHKKFRNWLSGHSILYRVTVHGLFAGVKGGVQIKNAAQLYPGAVSLSIPGKHIEEAFRPAGVYRGLKQDEKSVQEGLRITLQVLAEMNQICRSNHADFVVAIIPTKETVFASHLAVQPSLAHKELVESLVASESQARAKLISAFSASQIRYVDTLPALRHAIESEKLYTLSAGDMHPGRNGYRVIGEVIARELQSAAPRP